MNVHNYFLQFSAIMTLIFSNCRLILRLFTMRLENLRLFEHMNVYFPNCLPLLRQFTISLKLRRQIVKKTTYLKNCRQFPNSLRQFVNGGFFQIAYDIYKQKLERFNRSSSFIQFRFLLLLLLLLLLQCTTRVELSDTAATANYICKYGSIGVAVECRPWNQKVPSSSPDTNQH